MPNEYVYTPPALMSLSNPDTVVTEERLYQFYQQILPYLGGMPDILANKFSKADLYSTDEKMIGRWIDGKPLYQKYFTNANKTIVGDGWKDYYTDANFANYNIVGIRCFDDSGAIKVPAGARFSGTKLQISILAGASTNMLFGSFVLQYTKTTDSAVEIGDDTDYSTTEKIVGTWIDGKPIWQKTISFEITNTGDKAVSVSDLNIERCINLVSTHTANTQIPLGAYVDYRYGIYAWYMSDDGGKIFVRNSSDIARPFTVYSTIQYTKTSS